MSGVKLTARQKMINMMYLVLIALLAMNVSKEILKAFHLMEISFENTGKSLFKKMDNSILALNEAKKEKDNAQFYYDRALKAKQIVNEMNQYLMQAKLNIEGGSGGRAAKDVDGFGKPELLKGDALEFHAQYFNDASKGGKGNGKILRNKLLSARKQLLELLKSDGDSTHLIPNSFFTELENSSDLIIKDAISEDGVENTWENMFLIETPLAGAVTNIARLNNEVINLGNNVVSKLAMAVDANKFTFNQMRAFVNPKSNFVMAGSKYEADILLVASSTEANYQIKVGDQMIPLTNGIGKYTTSAVGVGNHSLQGEIIVPGKGPLSFNTEWTSFMPSATVSATNMNVLYIGLENPLSISVPGIAPSDIQVSMNNGNLQKKADGTYVATVSAGQNCAIAIKARMPDGSIKNMGTTDFRIRKVPSPTIKAGALTGGKASVGTIMAQNNIYAILDNFPYSGISYKVTSFTVTAVSKTAGVRFFRVNGDKIPDIRFLKADDQLFFTDVVINGPGKPNVKLTEVVAFTISK